MISRGIPHHHHPPTLPLSWCCHCFSTSPVSFENPFLSVFYFVFVVFFSPLFPYSAAILLCFQVAPDLPLHNLFRDVAVC